MIKMKRTKKRRGRPPDEDSLLSCHKKIFFLKEELEKRGISRPSRVLLHDLAPLCKEILGLSNIHTAYKWANYLTRECNKQYRNKGE